MGLFVVALVLGVLAVIQIRNNPGSPFVRASWVLVVVAFLALGVLNAAHVRLTPLVRLIAIAPAIVTLLLASRRRESHYWPTSAQWRAWWASLVPRR